MVMQHRRWWKSMQKALLIRSSSCSARLWSSTEIQFSHWRFNHVKLVERAIGDNVPGTAGNSGAGYLGKTLGYRFFPELWAARNVLTRTLQG